MKKAIAALVVGTAGVLAVLVVVIALQPAELHVERSIVVDAAPEDVAVWTTDLRKVNAWSPWMGLDPDQEITYSETTDEVGAYYTWNGNEDVGEGRLTIASIEDGQVTQDLHFDRPFESDAVVTMSWASTGEGTEVSWAMDSENDFMGKAVGMVMDMDAMLGKDFEKGLGMLKPLVEETREDREAAEAEEEEMVDTGSADTDAPE